MARQVTPALEKQLEATKKQAESNRREILSDAGKIVQKIDGQKLSFTL
jgi:ribosomal protein L9